MRIQDSPPIHLTYCLNVHPGEAWRENLAAIQDKASAVRDRVAAAHPELADRPFGLGLRLSARAAEELSAGDKLDRLREELERRRMYAFTINGFPFGQFHAAAVKENVYSPDWRSARRRDYTIRLADILARLLPAGVTGSISTVPGSYRPWINTREDVCDMAHMLADVAAHLHRLREGSGAEIRLGLEPEPECYVETTPQAIEFLAGPVADIGGRRLAAALGLGRDDAEQALRRHVGVCLDAAHAAVEFEDPAESLRTLNQAGVTLAKVQLSSALSLRPEPAALRQLEDFRDPVYLHQVKVWSPPGEIVGYPDLGEALATAGGDLPQQKWRVHFHVPLFFEKLGALESTSSLLTGEFAAMLRQGLGGEHLEIETYTWGILPPALRPTDVTEGIAREYDWVLANMLSQK